MTLDYPVLLAIGLLVTAALAVVVVLLSRRRRAALTAAGVAKGAPRRLGPIGVWLTVAGIAVLSVAAAGPSAAVPVPRTAGTVILAVDVSASMAADDTSPTRLAAAQQAARAFVRAQPDNVDIGLVAFEQGALTTALPSGDHQAALDAIDRLTVTGGTSLASAIMAALSTITGEPVAFAPDGTSPSVGYWPSATIVILSDGEDLSDGQDMTSPATIADAAALAQEAGVQVHTVGVGTAQGATVEVDGFRLHTALDEETLTSIAEATGGSYQPVADAAALEGVASTIDLRLTMEDEQVPLAGAFIVAALVLLTAGAVVTILGSGRVV